MKKPITFLVLIIIANFAFSQGGIKGTRNSLPAPNTTPSTPLSIPKDVVILHENMDIID